MRNTAWTAVDLVALFARSLIDPAVKSSGDAGSGNGARRVHTVHSQPVRGSGMQSGGGNRLGGSGASGGSGSGSGGAAGGSGPASGGRPMGRINGLGPTNCSPSGG